MNKLATYVVAGAALIGAPAFAADIAVKAPPPAPAPVYNWTGWYVGVNAGASFGNVNTGVNVEPFFINGNNFFAHSFSNREYPDGFMGGGQIGYNWQYSPLIVVGLEADIQGALERDSNNLINSSIEAGGNIGRQVSLTDVTNYTTQINWFGTARIRIGCVWGNGDVMSYVTGGLAYGEVKLNGTNSVSFLCVDCPPNRAALGLWRTS
jgi:outer membrane immunogenic protein